MITNLNNNSMEAKKFSISKLELARKNPIDFGNHLRDDEEEPFNNRPKSVRWLDSTSVYHKNSSLSEAITYLENSFRNRKQTKKNVKEVETLVNSLCLYVTECSALNYTHYTHKHKIEINLSSKLKTTGWVWIINTTSTGYSAYIVVNDNDSHNWQGQLRFPIIQNYVANLIFNCPIEDVDVGIINYTEGKHHRTCFSQTDITEALNELKAIGSQISSLL
ncbi:hypothetical protein [Flavobacterium sp. AJR]|uniref:hypothetical protein n=1 Tax=Flavobacterium sp. AJR TaxID=1979369 RepID=UPI000A3D7FFA|nr:hypothetical protein [Flavobacterium sp. AJR]OUL63949.1 hypothetical protein B8T70_02275 [Flavobacterium sp. AJR]